MTCKPHHLTEQPVCLDCTNLPIDCNESFKTEFVHRNGPKHDIGDPRWRSPLQTYGWPVVCGSDRKTYRNTCFLHIVNCLSNKFVELKNFDYCYGKIN